MRKGITPSKKIYRRLGSYGSLAYAVLFVAKLDYIGDPPAGNYYWYDANSQKYWVNKFKKDATKFLFSGDGNLDIWLDAVNLSREELYQWVAGKHQFP